MPRPATEFDRGPQVMRRRRARCTAALLGAASWFAAISLSLAPVDAGTLQVPADFSTIQAAIGAASDGDTILVAGGTYPEAIDFLGKRIVVASTAGAAATTLDGAALGASVVRFTNDETPEAQLIGFTIRNGTGTLSASMRRGGAIYCDGATPRLHDLILLDNSADEGGAVFCTGNASPRFVACRFSGNSAIDGAAIYANGASPIAVNCLFADNDASGQGGAVHAFFLANATFNGCTFTDNGAAAEGGGVYAELLSTVSFFNCILFGNDAPFGPEISASAAGPFVSHSLVAGGWLGDGEAIFDTDPLFADAGAADYRLNPASPVIGQGLNSAPQMEPYDLDGNDRIICGTVDLGCYETPAPSSGCPAPFRRGDCDSSGSLQITDAIRILSYLFQGVTLDCANACDGNSDAQVNLADAVFLLQALFVPAAPAPASPYPECETPSFAAPLSCATFAACP
jgi:hypothetical protein